MKKLTAEQIQENYQQILKIIDSSFTGKRQEKLKQLFTDLGERFMFAPASSIKYFHNAFPGGLCEHTLNVIRMANKLHQIWKSEGADVSDFEHSNLIFCALVHDIGKVGTIDEDYYLPNDSEWHIKNQGKIYKLNPNIPNMEHAQRSIQLLNHYGIRFDENEHIAILVHDGPSADSNKFYFSNFAEEKLIKSELPYILHMADFLAWRIEFNDYKKNKSAYDEMLKPKKKKDNPVSKLDADKMFDKLFSKEKEEK